MKLNLNALLLTTGLSWASPVQAATNLILNGSFEQPTGIGITGQYTSASQGIANWNITGSNAVRVWAQAGVLSYSLTFAQDGDQYLDLGDFNSNDTNPVVSQSFSTIPNTTYALSFYIGASEYATPSASIQVQLDGASPTTPLLATSLTPLPPILDPNYGAPFNLGPQLRIDWSLHTFSFVADSTTTLLSFHDSSTVSGASFIDNVSVVAVPEPSSTVLIGLSVAGILIRRRRNLPA